MDSLLRPGLGTCVGKDWNLNVIKSEQFGFVAQLSLKPPEGRTVGASSWCVQHFEQISAALRRPATDWPLRYSDPKQMKPLKIMTCKSEVKRLRLKKHLLTEMEAIMEKASGNNSKPPIRFPKFTQWKLIIRALISNQSVRHLGPRPTSSREKELQLLESITIKRRQKWMSGSRVGRGRWWITRPLALPHL